MKGLLTVLFTLAILASGCGSSNQPLLNTADTGDTDVELSALEFALVDAIAESGISHDAADCIVRELARMDINLLRLASSIQGDELPDELWDAANACGDELLADGTFDFSGGFGTDIDGYGDDPELDALWDACDAGDLAACDELYLSTPIGSTYEAFGSTCAGLSDETFGRCEDVAAGAATDYGDDPTLDALWDGCEPGDGPSCDELYWTSDFGSAYEAFGETCGERFDPVGGQCEEGLGIILEPGGNYGDDPVLDALWDACEAGEGAACDDLYLTSEIGSVYEAFGDTCGNRFPDGVFSCEDAMSA